MNTLKISLSIIILLIFSGLNDAKGQWATSGADISNTNTGNVGIGNSPPLTLLHVAKNMTEPTITVQNLGGTGGATYTMTDNASGANWKFKATLTGGFKIRDHANALDVFVIEPNSSANAIYINSAGIVGIGTPSPNNSALVDVTSTTKGFLPPRMTAAQRAAIVSPAAGLLVYQTNATSGLYYYTGSTWTAIASTAHYIGELFGGGIVFWVDNTGQHGLIASLVDISVSTAWSNISSTLIGTTAQSTWNGQGNTTAIIGQAGHTASAAKLCNDYTNANYSTGIFTDWYLPAIDQLSLLYQSRYLLNMNIEGVGGANIIALQYYWSSTEGAGSHAWSFGFNYGSVYYFAKSNAYWVRAIRAF